MKDFIVVHKAENENETDEIIWRSLTGKQFLALYFFCSTSIAILSILGVMTNLINIYIFLKLKLSESVDICLLGLSFSDFMYSVCNVFWGLSMILLSSEIYKGIYLKDDPEVMKHFSAGLSVVFYSTSALITMYIAIARCMCVLLPMQFRNVFTIKRSVGVIIIFILFSIAVKFPSYVSVYLPHEFVSSLNTTRLRVRNTDGKKVLRDVATMVTHTTLPFVTQSILLVCVMFINWGMRRSAQFRKQASTSVASEEANGKKESSGKLSQRELQVVQQVLLVCIIYLVCNTPKLMVGSLQIFFPDVKDSVKELGYERVYKLLNPARRVFECINTTVNILVYLKYNRKYRVFWETHWGLCATTNQEETEFSKEGVY